MSTKIKARTRGPLLVEGEFELYDENGERLADGRDRVLLCRCGASMSAPICDGSHNRIGFRPANQEAEPGGD